MIVDECHAYDAYMNRYLDTALAWLHEYNVPVILLSATLPRDRRKELIKAYLNQKNGTFELPETDYPRLTYTDGGNVLTQSMPQESAEKAVKITRSDEEAAVERIASAVGSGVCVGIICNTVVRAQHFAERIRNVDGAQVILYHAQYIIPDRMEREETLKKYIGKNSTAEMREGVVVAGTQVLEQSLDIDFDILVTELCPMDLLLQRIGRLQRHPRGHRQNVLFWGRRNRMVRRSGFIPDGCFCGQGSCFLPILRFPATSIPLCTRRTGSQNLRARRRKLP